MNELIPRALLFGNPERTQVNPSHDGNYLAYLAPVDGVMNLWVAPMAHPERTKAVTHDAGRGIQYYVWAVDHTHLIYLQDHAGDENWHIFCVNVQTLETKDLTPFENVSATWPMTRQDFPHEIVVGMNDRLPQFHDYYRINILTGERMLLEQNDHGFVDYLFDQQFRMRIGFVMQANGDMTMHRRTPEGWQEWQTIPESDGMSTRLLHFDADGTHLFMTDSRDRNTGALYRINLETGHKELLAEDARVAVERVLTHPATDAIQAVCFCYERDEWQILDPEIAPDLEYLGTVARGAMMFSRTLDDQTWIVTYICDDGPERFYRYDRSTRTAHFLFTEQPALEQQPLAQMESLIITARDGLQMVSFLTRPLEAAGPTPLVLLVHGGPWGRDWWGWNRETQFLANRGYAVLQVNYRGSTGFGKAHVNAGNLEWGAKMHDDLLDAIDWAVRKGITERETVAIMGASYGGYAALAGLTMTPDVFACGVDIVGPVNLITLLESMPAYWEPTIAMFNMRMGNIGTEDGRALLKARSPLTHAANISRPLLIGQGANDPKVKQAESDQIVHAMRENNIPVTYALFPDEGHGFARPENNLAFYAITEAFLAKHLGGRAEAIGTALEGSSMEILEGKDGIPGFPG
jgi:dipeptidyl aminopeptidase/acylaminoacyl peptidase